MSEITLARDIERAAHAARLIADDLLSGAFAALEADYIAAWRGTAARDTDARERLWQAVQIVGLVKAQLAGVVSHGRLAQHELDAIAGGRAKA